ncbi:MAG: chromosomal replication initiator protein DnaA [Lachnospiraceae bacterium]|nr:chromosomal replication initiator protein DnaA [Lachnospiraceae bacterium]
MKKLIESKWEEILSLLETQYDISGIMINTWIRSLKIYEVKDNTVYFYVDEKLGENAVKFLYRKEFDLFLLSSIRETLNDINVEIVIDEKKNYISDDETKQKDESSSFKEAISRSNLNPKYTFETFIVGDGNRHAHATCLAVADLPGQDNFNPLFLSGKAGLGKTHLMQSIAHYILQRNEKTNVLYVSSETFTTEIIDAIRNHTTNEFRDKYRKVDVLLIDDIQFIINKESTQTEFFNTFNELYNDNKQIILSSDRPPKELKSLDERIRSRFECGVPIDIHEPDYETRMAILRNKAEISHITGIPDEVFQYIAENVTKNIRDLEGALNKISIYSKLLKKEVTLEIAIDSLKDIINKDTSQTITPELIIKTVSEHLNISAEDIRSKKRSQDIATARQIVMYLCRIHTVLSLQTIGAAVGGKDHATVMNGIKRVETRMNEDASFKSMIDTIVKKMIPS